MLYHSIRGVASSLVPVMTGASSSGTSQLVSNLFYRLETGTLLTMGCLLPSTGRLVREFDRVHTSHIFDVKFDVARIVRSGSPVYSCPAQIHMMLLTLSSIAHLMIRRLSCLTSPRDFLPRPSSSRAARDDRCLLCIPRLSRFAIAFIVIPCHGISSVLYFVPSCATSLLVFIAFP